MNKRTMALLAYEILIAVGLLLAMTRDLLSVTDAGVGLAGMGLLLSLTVRWDTREPESVRLEFPA